MVNGRSYEVLIAPNMILSDLLREEMDLTGTKNACGVGECGSCTVLVDGRPHLSCSTLAIAVRDRKIETIEGLSRGSELHPLQEAFLEKPDSRGAHRCEACGSKRTEKIFSTFTAKSGTSSSGGSCPTGTCPLS